MDIEQYAIKHDFVYIPVKEIRKRCSNVLPFTVLGKTMMVLLPKQIYAEVREICEHDAFDYLLLSTKAGMAFNPRALHWVPATEDAFAWFTMRHDENVKTSLRIIAQGTPQPS